MRFPSPRRIRDLGVAGLTASLLLGVVGCSTAGAAPAGTRTATSATSSSIRSGRCSTDQLTVTVDSSRSGRQTIEPAIVLTNQSTRACTLQGAPGVAFVDRSGGRRIGPAALVAQARPAPEVTLQQGSSVEVDLIVDFPDKTAARCEQRDAAGFAVALPEAQRPLFVAYPYPACADKRLLAVFPLRPR